MATITIKHSTGTDTPQEVIDGAKDYDLTAEVVACDEQGNVTEVRFIGTDERIIWLKSQHDNQACRNTHGCTITSDSNANG